MPAPRILPPAQLADRELLQLVLGTTPEAAVDPSAELLKLTGSLGGLQQQDPARLLEVAGLGPARLRRLFAAIELGRRCLMHHRPLPRVESHHDVFEWALPRIVHLEHEELWLLSLDGRNALKAADRVAQGGLLGCAVAPRDILRPAVRNAAAAVVVVHNHPSGDPTPSAEDLHMTEQLARACDVLGIRLLDHVVVARAGAKSVAALGMLDAA